MTTYDYISLFLIDPVLRHTRRWSAFALSERPKDVCAGQVTTAEHATVLEHSVDCSESVAEDLVDPGCALADDEEADRGGLLEVPVVPPDRERALDPTSDPGGEREEAPGRRRHVPADRPEELRRDERVPVRTALRGSAGIEDGSSHASHGVVERFGPPGSSSGVRPRASAGTNFVSMMMVDGSEALPRSVPGRGMSEPGSPEPQASSSVSEILPADDGQRVLRQRILKIRNMPVTASETARLMHELMNERYRQLRAVHQRRPQHRKSPPGPSLSPTPEDQRPAPNAGSGDGREATPSSSSAAPASDDPYHLTVDDLKRTYVPVQSKVPRHGRSQSSHSDLDDDGGQATPHRLGCRHYKRNVKLQCSTCGRWYTCRFCHDEVEDHVLIRKDTEHMLCMLCGCPQPAAETCVNCAESMAWYYCAICKLWDDDSGKSIYHCNDCGICRIGRGLGKDYFHCKVSALLPFFYPSSHPTLPWVRASRVVDRLPGLAKDLRRLHVHRHRRLAQVHRALDRLRLSHLRRVHVQLARDGGLHAVRTQHPSQVLLRARQDVVPLPAVQQEHGQHGDLVPEPRPRHRESADADGLPGHQGPGLLQRLRRQEQCVVPLAGSQVRTVRAAPTNSHPTDVCRLHLP